jgi:RNA polymerase sigma-70 factor (ECF subfamily)
MARRDDDAPEDPVSAEAVRCAQEGDDRAREALFGEAQSILRAYFAGRIGPGPAVGDLVQNTLVRVHDGLADLRKPGSFKAFLMKAALYELQDYYRGRYDMKERLYDPDTGPERTGGDALASRLSDGRPTEAEMDVERALSALSDEARRVIELREYGYRYKEIARMTGTTEGAIKMRVKRAFDTMREALAALLALLAPGSTLLALPPF